MQRVIRGTRTAAFLLAATAIAACGAKKDFDHGEDLGDANTPDGEGGSRAEGSVKSVLQPGSSGSAPVVTTVVTHTSHVEHRTRKKQGTTRQLEAKPIYDLHNVTMVIPATSGLPDYAVNELPFTGAAVSIGQTCTDGQTPFRFLYSYPQNNFQYTEAHVVVDTARDSSGTEGIVVDGVFSGRPPLSLVNTSGAERVTDAIYAGSAAAEINTFYIDFSASHYKVAAINSFDLTMVDLLDKTTRNPVDLLKDGRLDVITGDDSTIHQAFLVIKGLTMTAQGDSLACANSNPPYTFQNDYVHNDGNSIGEAAVNGTLAAPFAAWSSALGTYAGIEFNFDSVLPKVAVENITVMHAKIAMTAKKAASGSAAVVINGVGIAGTGFDKTAATDVVEEWYDAATPAFDTWFAMVSVATGGANIDFDLAGMLGAEKVRTLVAQGKFNITFAGNLVVYAQAASALRSRTAAVAGPELVYDGTYITQICTVPDNANSPLTENGVVSIPDEYEDVVSEIDEPYDVTVVDDVETEVVINGSGSGSTNDTVVILNDGAGPVFSSVQASEITSTTATIYWLTDEPSTTQVTYGIGSASAATPEDTALTTFHSVHLTGLSPYKYYQFQVLSADKYGNASSSGVTQFVTLR